MTANPHAGWERRWAPAVLGLATLVACFEWTFGPSRSTARPATYWSAPTAPVPLPGTADPLVIAQAGTDSALSWIFSKHGGRAIRAVERARAAVVRIKATAKQADGPERLFCASSGILVDGGRHLLIAGHALDAIRGLPDPQFSVWMADGRARRVKSPPILGGVDGAPEGDWGLLELEDPPPERCPSLPMRAGVPGSTVVILGYPFGLGVDSRRRVVRHDYGDGLALHSLVFAGLLNDAKKNRVDLVASDQPAGGASGGAVIDLQGNLVGVYVTTHELRTVLTQTLDMGGPPDSNNRVTVCREYWFEITPVAVFREFVEARWKR